MIRYVSWCYCVWRAHVWFANYKDAAASRHYWNQRFLLVGREEDHAKCTRWDREAGACLIKANRWDRRADWLSAPWRR